MDAAAERDGEDPLDDGGPSDDDAQSTADHDASTDGSEPATSAADPDPRCSESRIDVPDPRLDPYVFSVRPGAVCIDDRLRRRCATGDECGAEYACCWGLCIPDGFAPGFCETCPCGDGAACEPSTRSRCDTFPTPSLEVMEEYGGYPNARSTPYVSPRNALACSVAPLNPTSGAATSSILDQLGRCEPRPDVTVEGACGFSIFDEDERESEDWRVDRALCGAQGYVSHLESYAHSRQTSSWFGFVTAARDRCHDETLRVTSSYDSYDGDHAFSYRVWLTGRSDSAVHVCRALWRAGEGWQVADNRPTLERTGATTWSWTPIADVPILWGPGETFPTQTVTVNAANRVTQIDDHTFLTYDDAGLLVSRTYDRMDGYGEFTTVDVRYDAMEPIPPPSNAIDTRDDAGRVLTCGYDRGSVITYEYEPEACVPSLRAIACKPPGCATRP